MGCKTVKLVTRPGPAVDEVDELEEPMEVWQGTANRFVDSAVMSAVRQTDTDATKETY